jgi:hypothetical protein
MARISAGTRIVLILNLLHVDRRTDTTKLVGRFEDSLFENASKIGVHTLKKNEST